MTLPEQVRRNAERANELVNQVNATPGEPTAAPAAPAPQVAPVAEPSAPAPAPAAPEPTTQAPPAPPVVSDWEQKYRTLQGVFNAEAVKWNKDKQAFEQRIAALEKAPAAPAPAPAPTSLTTDKDVETYGPEMMDVISRKATEIAQQIVAQQMAATQPQLEQMNQQVTQVAAQVHRTKEDKFFDALTDAVPDWEKINTDPRFMDWLAVTDPLSGVTRQLYLNDASTNLDASRTVNLFKAFKDAAGITAPAPAPAPAPAAAPAPAFSPSPRPVGAASAPSMNEPKTTVTKSEIVAHYSRSARDRGYAGSAEHKAFETKMQVALASNQVIEA